MHLYSDTTLFHWIIQSARVFALHFEASKSRHCPREAAVFGFWEEPAWVLLYCAFKMSSASDSHFAIKRSWSNSAGSKTLHALREGGGASEWSANWPSWRSCTSRQHWRPVALIVSLQSQESGSLKDPDTMNEVDLSRQKHSDCEVCKLHQVRVRSNESPSPVEPALRRTNRSSSRRSTPIPIIFVHNHLAAPLMEPRMDDAFDTAFPGRQFEFNAFSKKDESVIARVTKTSARCLMSLAILHKFVKHYDHDTHIRVNKTESQYGCGDSLNFREASTSFRHVHSAVSRCFFGSVEHLAMGRRHVIAHQIQE